MKRKRGFDEVMIVNPEEPGADGKARTMRFHNVFPSEMGEFAEPDYSDYGYFAEDQYLSEDPAYAEVDPMMGYYGELEPGYGYYGEVDPLGYYGQVDPMGYYGQFDPLGYYGEVDPMGYYGEIDPAFGYYGEIDPAYGYYAEPEYAGMGEAEPYGYFAEDFPLGYYGEDPYAGIGYYSQVPEMVGYGESEFAEDYPGVGYYGEPDYGGYGAYVRATRPAFNAGCPLPSNVSGFDDVDGFDGYMKPGTVNAACDQMTSQPGSPPSPPDTFKPLW